MEKTDIIWMHFGAASIAAVSSLMVLPGVMNPLVPMPFYLVILAWLISYGSIAALPLLYLAEFWFFRRKIYFGKMILITALVLSLLVVFDFCASWEYGVKYQGEAHTQIVAIENAIGFAALIILSYQGVRRNSKKLQYLANLIMFLLLAWCAFPYLGELL